jgi:hypothetical protein
VEHSPFDEKLVQRVLDTAGNLGYSGLHMVSGAGHDASYMNQIAPTAMIFVPSIGGRSHVEVEKPPGRIARPAANVLLHCLLQSANEKFIQNDMESYLGGEVFDGGCFFLNMLVELSGQSASMSKHILRGFVRLSRSAAVVARRSPGKRHGPPLN